MSYLSALGLEDDHRFEHNSPPGPGDLVATSHNAHPRFRVVAVAGDRAWLRCAQHGTDHIADVARCRRVEG